MNEVEIRNGYVLFWGGWASNWYLSDMVIGGIKYNCVEQYMMNKKAEYFGDCVIANRIMKTMDPKEQKKLGRGVQAFIMEEWDSVKYNIVLVGTLEKYNQNLELRKKLLETGDCKFVECSPYDRIWGIGMSSSDNDATNPDKWGGLNLLGKAIDEAREIIRNGI